MPTSPLLKTKPPGPANNKDPHAPAPEPGNQENVGVPPPPHPVIPPYSNEAKADIESFNQEYHHKSISAYFKRYQLGL